MFQCGSYSNIWSNDLKILALHFSLQFYDAAQGNNAIQSYIPDDSIDAKVSQQNQFNQETDEAHEEDMEIGYDDKPPTPTYEGLEQRFIDEIMKLVGERSDKENAEFARHNEVSIQYRVIHTTKQLSLFSVHLRELMGVS
jgi:hypothetical protein